MRVPGALGHCRVSCIMMPMMTMMTMIELSLGKGGWIRTWEIYGGRALYFQDVKKNSAHRISEVKRTRRLPKRSVRQLAKRAWRADQISAASLPAPEANRGGSGTAMGLPSAL